MRPAALALCAVLGAVTIFALAQGDAPKLSLQRGDTNIVITNLGKGAEGARSILNSPNCKENTRTTIFYAPAASGTVETITSETRLTSNVAIIEQPQAKAGETAPQNQETLELYNGTVTFQRNGCLDKITQSTEADVKLEQGRTTVLGTHFFLDREVNTGEMDGPITLNRVAEGDSPALAATSEKLLANLDSDTQTLTGNVRVDSDGRISEADSVDFDEANSLSILRGEPATSRKGDEFFQGNEITYYLDNNEVKVSGGVQGELTIDLGSAEPNTTASDTVSGAGDASPADGSSDTPPPPDLTPAE